MSFIRFLTVFASCGLAAFLGASFFTWFAQAAACDSRGHDANAFLAYCGHTAFGDYEHGAYYLGLERDAISHLRDVDVLFLGNSKLQYAFSTEATKRYFEQRRVRYYLLGFGYTEQSRFGISLVEKLALSPRVIVVNADPYFSTEISEPGKDVMSPGPRTIFDYVRKSAFTRLHPELCSFLAWMCTSEAKAIYRDAKTGTWILKGAYDPFAAKPVMGPAATTIDSNPTRVALDEARRLIRVTGIAPHCVILTATPNQTADTSAFARALASTMKLGVILPELPDMATMDGAHLHGPSAERWSAAFLAQLTPVLEACGSPDEKRARTFEQSGRARLATQYR